MWKRVRDWGSKLRLVPAVSSVATLAISTALVAKGALRLTAEPAAPPVAGAPRSVHAQPEPQVAPQPLAEAVLKRNIFDSTTGSMSWLDPAQAPPVQVDAGGSDALAPGGRCGDEVRLFASVVNARDPQRSLAALRKDGKTHLVPVGGSVGDLTLAALFPTHAYLRRAAGDTCFLPVYMSAHDAPPPSPEAPVAAADNAGEPPAAPVKGRKPALFSEAELQKHIRVLGPQSYAVTKELLLRARANPSGISRGTRFKSRSRDGRPVGMEVSVIRDDSLLAHLGLKKGDVLRQLNGFSLGSADGMLEVFGQLSKLDRLSLTIERKGEPQTLRFLLE
jgi:general secretion pathway protein C